MIATVGPQVRAIWRGTPEEAMRFLEAVQRVHEETRVWSDGEYRCSAECPHRTIMVDQRSIDGLVYVRRTVNKWLAAEWADCQNPDHHHSEGRDLSLPKP